MRLIRYGAAFALGYYLGQPSGRKQVAQLRQQAEQLLRKPEVRQLADRGKEMVGQQAKAAKDLARRRWSGDASDKTTTNPASASTGTGTPGGVVGEGADAAGSNDRPVEVGATSGFGGRTVAEDSEAARSGLVPPPPPGREPPATPER